MISTQKTEPVKASVVMVRGQPYDPPSSTEPGWAVALQFAQNAKGYTSIIDVGRQLSQVYEGTDIDGETLFSRTMDLIGKANAHDSELLDKVEAMKIYQECHAAAVFLERTSGLFDFPDADVDMANYPPSSAVSSNYPPSSAVSSTTYFPFSTSCESPAYREALYILIPCYHCKRTQPPAAQLPRCARAQSASLVC
jgi:hypothetical protein